MGAKEEIAKGKWVNCKICEQVFARIRQTQRYCKKCHSGFCEGEHGTMQAPAVCILCSSKAQ